MTTEERRARINRMIEKANAEGRNLADEWCADFFWSCGPGLAPGAPKRRPRSRRRLAAY
jgi:hypothetical protein